MRILDVLIKEYVSIVDSLVSTESIENNRIVIDRLYFKELLEKYRYMEFNQKTKFYKILRFIIHDKNNYTLPYKDSELKKTVRRVVFDYDVYIAIKYLYETDLNL